MLYLVSSYLLYRRVSGISFIIGLCKKSSHTHWAKDLTSTSFEEQEWFFFFNFSYRHPQDCNVFLRSFNEVFRGLQQKSQGGIRLRASTKPSSGFQSNRWRWKSFHLDFCWSGPQKDVIRNLGIDHPNRKRQWVELHTTSTVIITQQHTCVFLHIYKTSSCLSSSAVPRLGLQAGLVARLQTGPAVALPPGAAGSRRGRRHRLGRGVGRVCHQGPREAGQAVGGEEGQTTHELRQAQPGAQVMQNARFDTFAHTAHTHT